LNKSVNLIKTLGEENELLNRLKEIEKFLFPDKFIEIIVDMNPKVLINNAGQKIKNKAKF
jgi:hypothetical protein